MRIAFILGTRPEIIKLFPLISDCQTRKLDFFIIHTNQHYNKEMDAIFFSDLGLPEPRYNLNVGSGSQGQQLGQMFTKIEQVLIAEMPDVVIVQGDTNTVLAGALIANRYGIKVAHVEAGLRSYDRTMPEEINRIITDNISDLLFCPTKKQEAILINEGISKEKITVTGNTVVEAVYRSLALAEKKSTVLERLNIKPESYFLLTCHRQDNTDNKNHFDQIIRGISNLALKHGVTCVFPMHPRLKNQNEFVAQFSNIKIIEPTNYFDSLILQKYSKMIFTDSGGIQEESCILEKKCLILRLNTERPETLEVGGAILLNDIKDSEIERCYNDLSLRKVTWYNPFGDNNTSERILNAIENVK